MTIVTTRPRKRAVRPAQAATIKVPRDRAAYAEGQGVEAAARRPGGQGAGCRVPDADDPAKGRDLEEKAEMDTTCPRVSDKCPLCGLALPEACPLDEAPPFDGPAVGAVTTPGRERVETSVCEVCQ